MQQKTEDVKYNVSTQDLKVYRPRTRAFIKREVEDNKEYLKRALYSPVKIETPTLELSKYENNGPTRTLRSSSRRAKNRHYYNICNIRFMRDSFLLDHNLHFHNTTKTAIVDLKRLFCNLCDLKFKSDSGYRRHLHKRNIFIPPHPSKKSKPDPSITPDINDPNNHCNSCNLTWNWRSDYFKHLAGVHRISDLGSARIPRKPKYMKPIIDISNHYCDVCNRKFGVKISYVQHLVRVHEMTLPETYSEPSNFDLESLYCKLCDKRYSYEWDFKDHLDKIHSIAPRSRSNLILM